MQTDREQTVLVLHPSSFNPYPFLERLTQKSSGTLSEEPVEVPWTIDNKYYTSDVTFQVLEVGDDDAVQAKDIPIVLYLFSKAPSVASPTLIKLLMAEPRDIALAVRVAVMPDDRRANGADDEDEQLVERRVTVEPRWEDVEEMFEEVGMELIDETQSPEDDDERPTEPIEGIRQTLMTHMWPKMVRKPSGRGPVIPAINTDPDSPVEPEQPVHGAQLDASGSPVTGNVNFPTTFASSPAQAGPSRPSRSTTGAMGVMRSDRDGDADGPEALEPVFPGLAELKAQIELEDFERYETTGTFGGGGKAFGRLEAMDDDPWEGMDGPGEEEYARLDEWLDGDEPVELSSHMILEDEADQEVSAEPVGNRPESGGLEQSGGPHDGDDKEVTGTRDDEVVKREGDIAGEGFEDDFDDFSAFQSASSSHQPPSTAASGVGGDPLLSLDPTPLLLHLQSVRAELAGVTDEDERRVRAGKEVARVMRDMGMGGDLGLEDLDFDDVVERHGDEREGS